jgi:hypothetical protein
MLNHILKNSIAGAACLLELDDQALSEQGCKTCRKSTRLRQALDQLYKSMQWCSLRQVMVDLSAGRYQSLLSPVDVGGFLAGLCNGAASFSCEDTTVLVRQDTHSIAFDEKIAILAMENGVTNALAHGDGIAINLRAEFFQENSNGNGKIILSVENGLPPEKRHLTAQDLKNSRDLALQEIAARKLDFVAAVWKLIARSSDGRPKIDLAAVRTAASSGGNRSGLRHTGRACIGAGGSFDLFLRDERGKHPSVIMQIVLPAQLAKKSVLNTLISKSTSSIFSVLPTTTDEFDDIPEGLKICAIDDSKVT